MYLQHILQQKAVPTGGKWFFERRMAGHRHKKEVRTCCSTTQTKLLLARRADRREGVWIEVGPESEPHPGCWAGYTASDPDTGAQAASLEMGNCGRCSVASLQKTQHFYTTKRTTWISVDLFWNQICPIFLLKVSTLKNIFFELFVAHLEGDAVGSTKCLCRRVLLPNALRMTQVIQQNVTTKWLWVKSQKWSKGPHAKSCCDPALPAKAGQRVFCTTQCIPT